MSFNGGHHSKRRRMDEENGNGKWKPGSKREARMNSPEALKLKPILLFNILKPLYPITVDILHSICQPSGRVLRISIFEKNGVKALVEFDHIDSALKAREALNGADIFSGCCTLQIDFAKCDRVRVRKNDKESWDYTVTLFTNAPNKTREVNKRQLIDAQLDKLFSLTTITKNTAASMKALLATIKESLDKLYALGQTHKNWDCILVHHITRNLDHSTREKWEESLGTTTEYPTFEQLISFLKSCVRSLEDKEHSASQLEAITSRKSPPPRKIGTVAQSASGALKKNYACDCCGDDHYVAHCTKYKNYSLDKRCSVVHKQQLCYNCLGRHNVRSCRSQTGCQHCNKKHHTSLHGMDKKRNH